MGALLPNQGGSTPTCCLPVPWSPTLGVNPGPLPLAPAALAQDPAAEAPSDSSVTSVLLSITRSHPEAQQLLVMVYSLLTIICSQGGSACPSLGQGRGARGTGCAGPSPEMARLHCMWLVCSTHSSLFPPQMCTDYVPGATMGFARGLLHVHALIAASALLTSIQGAPGCLRTPAGQAGAAGLGTVWRRVAALRAFQTFTLLQTSSSGPYQSLNGQLGSQTAQGHSPRVLCPARGRAGGWVIDHKSLIPLWGV